MAEAVLEENSKWWVFLLNIYSGTPKQETPILPNMSPLANPGTVLWKWITDAFFYIFLTHNSLSSKHFIAHESNMVVRELNSNGVDVCYITVLTCSVWQWLNGWEMKQIHCIFILLLRLTLLYFRSFACYCIFHSFQLFQQLFSPWCCFLCCWLWHGSHLVG